MSTHEDDAWVADLLAAAAPPPLPDDVAERLDRAVRAQVAAHPPLAAAADRPATATDAPAAAADAAPATTDPTPAVPAPAPAPASAVPPPALVPPPAPTTGVLPAPARRQGDEGPGTTGTTDGTHGTDDADRADGAAGADGAGTTDGAEATGAADAADGDRPRPGWATSRRQQREEQLGERRRTLLTRWLPVAAGVLVLGAGGAAVVGQLGGGDEAAVTEAGGEAGAAEDAAGAAPLPRALVATGTDYTPGDDAAFAAQVDELVRTASSGPAATAGQGEGDASLQAEAAEPADEAAGGAEDPEGGDSTVAPQEAAADDELSTLSSPEQAPDARSGAVGSPLADTEALRECVLEVTEGGSEQAAAVDLASVDGLLSTVVVVADASGEGYFVYVTDPDCGALRSFYRVGG